ncbi:Nitrilase/cyanide hydratase and apolipoprotein N-acyltransferase [metagenome]|uniref:Nitrilase/cyanide hydratase and apolipoprotein N-acyltransferase n=1 Tax=metagenome TaxID=256318 RepID=A0A2P2C0Y6_9ZZZZ
MQVALIQDTSALDPVVNRERLARLCPAGADLVVFPEAFARDFGPAGSSVAAFAEPIEGPFATEVAAVAARRHTTIVAGMFETSDDPRRPFNTLVTRGAATVDYRKIHLYDSFGYRESDNLSPGALSPVTFALGDVTVGLMTCYDLRFPELSRRLVDLGADVLVVPSAWVAGPRKVDHWLTLARARAIENTVYVVAAGQCGPRYSGHSVVVDPLGDILVEGGEDPVVLTAELDLARVREARETNPSLANRRL